MITILSICTPTFNRKHTLQRLYDSLISQNKRNFEWIIIDDGSTDGTKTLVDRFINENLFPIKYLYQSNQGKHVALNKGQKLATRSMFVCLDSDDWFVNETTEIIEKYWEKIKNNSRICGIILLDKFTNNKIVGSELPHESIENWISLKHQKNMMGDKCYIFKTNILKYYEFPNFESNNHMPPSYQLYLMSEQYDFLCVNISVKFVEYLPDGISHNIVKKYFSAPDNYTYFRKKIHRLLPKFSDRLKNSVHYNITYFMSRKHKELKVKNIRQRLLNILMLPISIALLIYLKIKRKW